MPLGSFNKKLQQQTDSRVAATDNAIVIREGGFIFNPGRDLPNQILSAPAVASKPNWYLIGALAAGALLLLVMFTRK